jgi:hypothetical protein
LAHPLSQGHEEGVLAGFFKRCRLLWLLGIGLHGLTIGRRWGVPSPA